MLRSRFTGLFFVLAVVSGPALVGCGGEPPAPEAVGQTGTLSAALTATGTDGASYRFPAGTALVVQTTNGSFTAPIPLDGTGTDVTQSLAVGSFLANVSAPNGFLQLEKDVNGTPVLVNATLVNPQPMTFDIAENATTELALDFSVAGLADVSFRVGQVHVSVGVTVNGVTTGTGIFEIGDSIVSNVTFGSSASDAARALLGANVGDEFLQSVNVVNTGDWRLITTGEICVSGTLVGASFTTEAGIAPRMQELQGSSTSTCVTDTGANDFVFISALNETIPADQTTALPSSYQVSVFISGVTPVDVFDGVHFNQSAFETPMTLTSGSFSHTIFDLTASDATSSFSASVNPRFTITP